MATTKTPKVTADTLPTDTLPTTPADASNTDVTPAPDALEAKHQDAVEVAAGRTLKTGEYEFAAPGYLGGCRVTLRKGEPVPAEIWEHVPEADRDLFN